MAVEMGLDIGQVRIGVAITDPAGIFALPWKTLLRDKDNHSEMEELIEKISEDNISRLYVGLPKTLQNTEGQAVEDVKAYINDFSQKLEIARIKVEFIYIDERMTTVIAHNVLYQTGKSKREHKQIVDQVAAQKILEQGLNLK